MDFTSLIVQAVAGAVGGNAGGAVMKNASLGVVGNTIAGAVGGGVIGQLLPIIMGMATQPGGFSISNIIASGAGGLVLQIVAGFIKSKMA
jgi:hypothetical protein